MSEKTDGVIHYNDQMLRKESDASPPGDSPPPSPEVMLSEIRKADILRNLQELKVHFENSSNKELSSNRLAAIRYLIGTLDHFTQEDQQVLQMLLDEKETSIP